MAARRAVGTGGTRRLMLMLMTNLCSSRLISSGAQVARERETGEDGHQWIKTLGRGCYLGHGQQMSRWGNYVRHVQIGPSSVSDLQQERICADCRRAQCVSGVCYSRVTVARDSVQVLPEGAFGELAKQMLASWLVHVLDTVTLV